MQTSDLRADTEKRVCVRDLENRLDFSFNHGVSGSIPAGLTRELKHLAEDAGPLPEAEQNKIEQRIYHGHGAWAAPRG
jgi:hypothetical protein